MQEKKFSLSSFLDLPFLMYQTIEKDSWVLHTLWVRLEDYRKFVSDESGHMRRSLFDSDGWDFLSTNQANEQIIRALADPADLWTLNNGVTMIAANACVVGRTMQLQDIQIINGLQLTKIIYYHCQGDSATSKDKDGELIIKIIVTSDKQVRDRIIEATSYQGQPVTIVDLKAICNAENSARYRGNS